VNAQRRSCTTNWDSKVRRYGALGGHKNTSPVTGATQSKHKLPSCVTALQCSDGTRSREKRFTHIVKVRAHHAWSINVWQRHGTK
jgi:hypothetical protein